VLLEALLPPTPLPTGPAAYKTSTRKLCSPTSSSDLETMELTNCKGASVTPPPLLDGKDDVVVVLLVSIWQGRVMWSRVGVFNCTTADNCEMEYLGEGFNMPK
jgi:hypothetical protein